jgi:hypothetical protein
VISPVRPNELYFDFGRMAPGASDDVALLQRIDYLSYGSGHAHQVRCGAHGPTAMAPCSPCKPRSGPRVLHFHTDLVGTPMEVTDEAGRRSGLGG